MSTYEGDYRDGKRNGRGMYARADGNRYEGEYREDLRHGQGVFHFANGTRYEGEYRDGKPHGHGTFTRDGVTHTGTWTNGCFRQGGRWAYANTTAEDCGFIPSRTVSTATPESRGGIQGRAIEVEAARGALLDYIEEVRRRIRPHWRYPCLSNPAGGCDYLNAELVIEIGILASGQLQFTDVRRSSKLAIYDESALNAVKTGSPYPQVPEEMMAMMTRGSTGVAIAMRFRYAVTSGEAHSPSGGPLKDVVPGF